MVGRHRLTPGRRKAGGMLAARGRVRVTPRPNPCCRERDDHPCITRQGTRRSDAAHALRSAVSLMDARIPAVRRGHRLHAHNQGGRARSGGSVSLLTSPCPRRWSRVVLGCVGETGGNWAGTSGAGLVICLTACSRISTSSMSRRCRLLPKARLRVVAVVRCVPADDQGRRGDRRLGRGGDLQEVEGQCQVRSRRFARHRGVQYPRCAVSDSRAEEVPPPSSSSRSPSRPCSPDPTWGLASRPRSAAGPERA